MDKLSIFLQVFAVLTASCGALAAILPPSKFQHWLAWAGTFATKKPLPEAPKDAP